MHRAVQLLHGTRTPPQLMCVEHEGVAVVEARVQSFTFFRFTRSRGMRPCRMPPGTARGPAGPVRRRRGVRRVPRGCSAGAVDRHDRTVRILDRAAVSQSGPGRRPRRAVSAPVRSGAAPPR
ncbi:hypothetical protein SFR_1672 [Streptomyces sp. FR-008]|nr:hypothetical protein SFR_1672 [Streptomyces sp. FR-008]